MIPFYLSTIANFLCAKLINMDQIIESVSIDSRIIGKKCLFIALRGSFLNGHDFIIQAIQMGAKALLVDHYLALNISQLIVSNTTYALGSLGAWMRNQTTARIIAITGSVGKTSVKEMTTNILTSIGKVVATYRNFNNEIGVPLTLLRLSKYDDFAVIELGTSSFGEIFRTVQLVRPEVVLINNISYTHLSKLNSLYGVSKAKGEIFVGLSMNNDSNLNNKIVLNVNSHNWLLWSRLLCKKSVWWFSLRFTSMSDFFASDINVHSNRIDFIFHSPQGKCKICLPFFGYHNVVNAVASGALAMSVGASLSEIRYGLETLKFCSGRLCPIVLSNGKLLLDDSYNSSVGSMYAACQVLRNMPGYRVLVVSDMVELGCYNQVIMHHYRMGKIAFINNIDIVLSFGYFSQLIVKAHGYGIHFCNKLSLINFIITLLIRYPEITVLVKGSRIFSMDYVVKILQEKWLCYYA